MHVVPGSSSRALAGKLATALGCDVAKAESKVFPDSERYVRVLDGVEEAVLVQNAHPDGNLVEILLWADALREAGATWVAAVVPYLGYARQDKVFEAGEALSIRPVAKALQRGLDAFVTVDVHNPAILPFFDIPAESVSGAPAIARHVKGRVDAVLSPDEGGKERAEEVAELLGVPWDFLEKSRLDARRVVVQPKSLAVEGKAVVIMDDIISTGGTIVAATESLRKNGASRVVAACTHGLFAEGALEKLKVCDEVVATDTVENPVAVTSVAREVAEAITGLR